jgi:hypothetical protein
MLLRPSCDHLAVTSQLAALFSDITRVMSFAFADKAPISTIMNKLLIATLMLAPTFSIAQDNALTRWTDDHSIVFDAAELALDDFIWAARPIVVFAQSENDPQFQRQMTLLLERVDELSERDVVIITDTDPDALTDVRQQLRPRGFMLALLGKDGQVKLRKPAPWDVRELSRSIDKMPMRQQEIRDRRVVPD